MKYSEKRKKSMEFKKVVGTLRDGDTLHFKYTHYEYAREVTRSYKLKCYANLTKGDYSYSYSIWNNIAGMNVEQFTSTGIDCYTYDMMSTRTNYRFPLYDLVVGNIEPKYKPKDVPGFEGTLEALEGLTIK